MLIIYVKLEPMNELLNGFEVVRQKTDGVYVVLDESSFACVSTEILHNKMHREN